MAKQMAFYFDSSACSGCKTCQVACKDKNNSPQGVRWRRVYEAVGGFWEQQGRAWVSHIITYNMSLACNHCSAPICLTSCPNRAIVKDDLGVVWIDKKRCMGCRYCELTCPYGALQYDPDQKVMTKCDLCVDYLMQGQTPVCVVACPMRALEAGDLEELKLKYDFPDVVFPLPQPDYTQPSLVVKPHPAAMNADDVEMKIANMEEIA